ncbi:hypothetical protein XENOCAPTIV_028545, partial [Xenoophorus captivus]
LVLCALSSSRLARRCKTPVKTGAFGGRRLCRRFSAMEDRCSPENERMEAWLDDHLEFTLSYFVKKASRCSRLQSVIPQLSIISFHHPVHNQPPSAASSTVIINFYCCQELFIFIADC